LLFSLHVLSAYVRARLGTPLSHTRDSCMKLKQYLTAVMALGLQGVSVSEAHSLLEEGLLEHSLPEDHVDELCKYLTNVMDTQGFIGCLHAPVDKFIEGRIRSIEKGYHHPPVVPESAFAVPGEWKEDASGSGWGRHK